MKIKREEYSEKMKYVNKKRQISYYWQILQYSTEIFQL